MTREEILVLRPVRRATWSDHPGPSSETGREDAPPAADDQASTQPADTPRPRVTIERPLPAVRGFRSLLQRLSALTGVRRVRLDERGSFVWQRIDGERTVEEIAGELAAEFGPEVEPADERVALLLRSLDRERFIELRDAAGQPVKLGRT